MVSFIISLAITALIYGLGPLLLLAFHRSPISPKKLKWFHIIYTVVISLICNFISSASGNGASFTPAIIWGLIFYIVNKSQFSKRVAAVPQEKQAQQEAQMQQFVVDSSTGEVISEPEEPKPVTLEYHPDFQLKGPPEEPKPELPVPTQKPSGKSYKMLCIVLGILLAASLAGNAVQNYMSASKLEEINIEMENLQTEVKKLNGVISFLRDENDRLDSELSKPTRASDIPHFRYTRGNDR